MSVLYHNGKANVVAYTLSQMSMGSAAYVPGDKKHLVKDVHRLDKLFLRLEYSP